MFYLTPLLLHQHFLHVHLFLIYITFHFTWRTFKTFFFFLQERSASEEFPQKMVLFLLNFWRIALQCIDVI